jgi:hypothetical protein
MTKRQRAIQTCQTLYKAAKQYDVQNSTSWGIHTLTVHVPGRIYYFRNGHEARQLARKIIKSFEVVK